MADPPHLVWQEVKTSEIVLTELKQWSWLKNNVM